MKRNYAHIIDVMLGVLFVLLLFGFAQSITFLDYRMAYFEPAYSEFASLLFQNDGYLIGFTSFSIVLCISYCLLDLFKIKHSRFIQAVLGVLLMGIAAYMFILLCGLRNNAFNIDNSLTATTFSLYKEYRMFSLEIILSQFLIALHALIRSILHLFHSFKEEKKTKNDSL